MIQMVWVNHNPCFAMDHAPELPQHFMKDGPWSGHRRFAYDLIRYIKPRNIVELGTHYGTSFFSFCQAVKDSNQSIHCYAVDTWQGDPHAGFYGEDVFQAVQSVTAREFPHIGTLLRSNFDHALSFFQPNTIDLLHIDGYHTYEAVSHDYKTWYPMLAERGIVLFHDIAEYHGDFGVYRLWEQLRGFPHLEFPHSHGLGVLFPKAVPESLQSVLVQKDSLITHYLKSSIND